MTRTGLSFLAIASMAFSAAPHRILVDRFVPTEIFLYTANADGTNEHALFPEKKGELDYNPSFSMDGQWIVFTSERDGSADIYRVRKDGSALERLTDNPAYDDQASFSPDGRRIIFVSSRDGGRAHIWTLDLKTHATKRLTNGEWGDFRPSFSPDGKWVAFSSDRNTPYEAAKGHWEQAQFVDVYLMRPDGSGVKRLTMPGRFCGSPKWSADGQKLAIYCMEKLDSFINRPSFPSGKSELFSLDVATGALTPIAASPGVNMSPAFVGNDVGYVRKDLAAPGIYYASGKTGPKGTVRSPSWSPDGQTVVYQRMISNDRINGRKLWSREPDFEFIGASENPVFNSTGDMMLSSQNSRGIWSLNMVDTKEWKEKLFYKAEGKSAMNGHWSPDDSMIVFAIGSFFNNRYEGTLQGAQLATIKPDGSAFEELTHGANNNNFPSYSPDGKQIAYRTIGSEGQGIRVMNMVDKSIRPVTNGADNFPVWSPRGDLIVFTRLLDGRNYEIFTVRPDGSDVRRLTNTEANEGHAIWSPDGEMILFLSARMGFKDEGSYLDGQQPHGEIFVMKYDGTGVRQLTDNQWEDGMSAWWPEPKAHH